MHLQFAAIALEDNRAPRDMVVQFGCMFLQKLAVEVKKGLKNISLHQTHKALRKTISEETGLEPTQDSEFLYHVGKIAQEKRTPGIKARRDKRPFVTKVVLDCLVEALNTFPGPTGLGGIGMPAIMRLELTYRAFSAERGESGPPTVALVAGLRKLWRLELQKETMACKLAKTD